MLNLVLTDEESLSYCFIESVYSFISSDPRQPMPDLFERTAAMVGSPVATEEVEDDEEGDSEEDAVAVAAGMTAVQLADQIGVELSQINGFIGNNQKPSQEIALGICQILDIKPIEIMA